MHHLGRSALTCALAIGGGLSAVAVSPSAAQAAPTVVATTLAGNGFSTKTETPGLGSVALVTDASAPLGPKVAELSIGPGDPANNKGGKPYLVYRGAAGTPLGDLSDLAYSTYVEDSPGHIDPTFNVVLASDQGWQGTLVFDPSLQSDANEPGPKEQWTTYDVSDPDALFYFSRAVVDQSNTVVIPRMEGHPLADFEAAFAANPGKYGNIRVDSGGESINVSFGQTAYNPQATDVSARVDGMSIGTPSGVREFDFADGLGPCTADVSGTTYTLTEDCTTSSTITAPDGATIDGAGHTITAVESTAVPNFQGSVLQSATGSDTAPASLSVHDLNIDTDFSGSNSGGSLNGIYYYRAGGSLSNVTVNGITHGNGVQEGNAVSIRNRVSGDNIDVPRAKVSLSDITVTNFQKTGVLLDGNLTFTATGLDVGPAGDPEGNPLPQGVIGANGVQISRGARGTLTDSTVANNSYDGSTSSAILLYNARTVTISHNVISGGPGDYGLVLDNESNVLNTVASVTCNLVSSSGTALDGSVGILGYANDETALEATLTDNTVTGWETATDGVDPVTGAEECGPAAPEASATGGVKQVTVDWTPGDEAPYAPITGYTVTLSAGGGVVATKHVAASANEAVFTGLTEGKDYSALVEAENVSGTASDTASVSGTKFVGVTASTVVKAQQSGSVKGALQTLAGDPVADGTVSLQQRPRGTAAWTTVGTTSTGSDGGFVFSTSPAKRTNYRVLYAGDPNLSATSGSVVTRVAPVLSLTTSASSGAVGSQVTFTGTVTPATVGSSVLLQKRIGTGAWSGVKSVTVKSGGTFTIPHTLAGPPANQQFRVVRLADPDYAQGASNIKTIKVTAP